MPAHLANLTGIASNYINFLFVNSLVFISIRYTHLFNGLPERTPSTESEPYKPEQVRRVEALTAPDGKALTILEIMEESGFTSKSTFNAIFKKQVGQTPSQYRKLKLETN